MSKNPHGLPAGFFGGRSSGSSNKQDMLKKLRAEKDEKYQEIGRVNSNITALQAEINQKNGILQTMTGRNMAQAYARLDEEIAGLVREKRAEQEAKADLQREFDTIKDQIRDVQQNW